MKLMWWRKTTPDVVRPTDPIVYPDGIAVSTEDNTYFIKGGVRYRFPTQRVLDSWGLTPAIGSEASVQKHKMAKAVMGFRDGTLLLDFTDNVLYLVSGSKRRRITDPDWLDRLNLDYKDAIVASTKEVMLHNEGDDLV